jgi:hypothetical protein
MKDSVKKEAEILIKYYRLNCSIEEFKDQANWIDISCYQILSEYFIREFQNKIIWTYISRSQKLSEDFIREFKDKISWGRISYSQKLSENFVYEFQDKLDIDYLIKNNRITKERLLKLERENKVNNKYELLQL